MNYENAVELEFQSLKSGESGKKRSGATGKQNVMRLLLDRNDRIWWWSWEIAFKTNSEGGWISHRGPAWASDLAIQNPDLVECRTIGRFAVYRARIENIDAIEKFLTDK